MRQILVLRSPQLPEFHDKDLTYYPDNIVNAYLETISTFGNGIEYRSSRRSQKFGRFLRMIDRESRWDYRLGLPTLITSVLHLNMIGYPFVLPDMIGGNGYNNEPPSKEMYIRWMQANTFMLVVQFSYTPWDFDQQVGTAVGRNAYLKYVVNSIRFKIIIIILLDDRYM